MIKVITASYDNYIIDEENKRIKRIPRPGTTFQSTLRGMVNVGEWQPYTAFEGLQVGKSLHVIYPNEQNWTRSTNIVDIDYNFQETEESTI